MKTTIDMAREAGIELDLIDEDEGQIWYITTEGIKAFEALVRADEREACAKDFEAEADTWAAWPQAGAAKRIGAAAIRARGNA
jgi:hypothetical protein